MLHTERVALFQRGSDALAERRAATERWWDARSPWARFRAHCAVLAWLREMDAAQAAIDAGWQEDPRAMRIASWEVD